MKRWIGRLVAGWMCVLPVAGFGQYYDWGRSPSGIRWNQANTVAGKIVYPDYFSAQAARVANYMDTVRSHVSYGFKYGPLRFPVILHTENFVANGIVMWAPKRIELEAIPPLAPFAEPWLKQLVTHEYRHAVQYGNLHRRFMKWVGYVVGQQAGLLSSVLLPIWFLEGDAVMNETQMASFGRALQPSFTIEYRAYLTEGTKKFPLDKWFCGSYKNYIPDHYQFGYQLAAWSREQYGDDMWSRVAEYGSKYPYTILTTKWALHKYYRTSVNEIARNTLDELTRFWRSQPVEPNSGETLPTPITSYTVYDAPMALNDTTLLALKRDMDKTSRVVAVDPRTGCERRLFWTGSVNTPPVLYDSTLYWTEYRSSTLWEQRVTSRACSYDLRTGRRRTLRERGKTLFPTPLPDGRLATVGYDYAGRYSLDPGDGRRFDFPDTLSIHGLAYDEVTGTLAAIALGDAGMSILRIDLQDGALRTIKEPTYASLYNLRAGAGKLSFNSIQSGKDEIHLFDLTGGREYRLSRSRYGSVAPSAPDSSGELYFTTYSLDGYRLARQSVRSDSLIPVEPRKLPENRVNPPRRKWDVMNIDTVTVSGDFPAETRKKRFRKGLHLFNLHSWAPWDFNPFHIADENRIDISFGATVMSQNLLSSTSGYLAYGYAPEFGSRLRGGINYYGLAPKFELSFEYGGGKQLLYGVKNLEYEGMKRKNYFQVNLLGYLPMTLASGHRVRTLTPSVELRHINALMCGDSSVKTGFQRLVTGLNFSDNVRMATRDFLPRWGYAARFAMVCAPFTEGFGRLYSLYGRAYLPGVMKHHSLMLRGNLQHQNLASQNFFYKELFPRGAAYNIVATRLGAASADYQFPVWCPDGGISSIVYFSRIRLNVYYDFARFRQTIPSVIRTFYRMHTVTSYGGEIIFDMHPLRIPAKTTTVGFYIYKPSDRSGVVGGVKLSLPI